jgi:hypothetical protein
MKMKFTEWLSDHHPEILEEGKKKRKKKWIQKAVDPEHEGYCTPITKKTCTPRRKALALRFKKGDIHKSNIKKGKNPKGKG